MEVLLGIAIIFVVYSVAISLLGPVFGSIVATVIVCNL